MVWTLLRSILDRKPLPEGSAVRSAITYRRDGRIYVLSQSKTVDGLWLATAPKFEVEETDAPEVGRALLRCLSQSRTGIPHPKREDWPTLDRQLVEFLGVKSIKAFERSALCATVSQAAGGLVTLTPTARDSKNGGFVGLSEKSIMVEGSDRRLGEILIECLRLSK